ncbi:PREDICTED: transmembrane channel-like protein 4, partial [Papilio polytes]|uniref:transmembrane channel-like protein 4 n=1 Tax=Papilio polytes TaxID=76194 RepID=UPI00067658FB
LDTDIQHWEIFVSLIITFVVSFCPLLFNLIVKMEYYKTRTALYVTLARTGLLHISTLTMLLVYWTHSDTPCWESALGREAYRLVLLDSLVSLFLLPLVEFARGFFFKCGTLQVWRAAQTQTVLYMLVTLSLFVTIFSIGSLFLRGSSEACGPFVTYERVWGVVSEGVLRLHTRPALRRALAFLTRPGVIAFAFLCLCVATYLSRARARAQRSMAAILRRMLLLQAKDKDFLLAAIDKVSNGEWLYNPREEEQPPDSHTLKYLQEVRKPSNAAYHFDVSRLNHSLSETRAHHSGNNPHHSETRPHSYHVDRRRCSEDGETDSSFSWQGSGSCLNVTKDGKLE